MKMKISAVLPITMLFSFNQIGSCTLLRGTNENNDVTGPNSLERKLWEECCWKGKCANPGQWLEESEKECMCNQNGDGSWVNCRSIDDETTKEPAKKCCHDGTCSNPGQWSQGSMRTCMCNQNGDGSWVNCKTDDSWEKTEGTTHLQRSQQFNPTDFVFDLLGSTPNSVTNSGSIQVANVVKFRSLEGHGISTVLFNLEPCGINLPHIHLRATELLYVISGENVQTVFGEENGSGSRTIVNNIREGQVTFFPQGTIHYQQNLGCKRATYISTLNSEDPGVITITTKFFDFPKEAVQSSLGAGNNSVNRLIKGLPSGPAAGQRECMIKCGIW